MYICADGEWSGAQFQGRRTGMVTAELNSLEAKVAQLVAICERLRAENIALRQELAAARNDAKRLNDKIDGARVKVEQLIARLPE